MLKNSGIAIDRLSSLYLITSQPIGVFSIFVLFQAFVYVNYTKPIGTNYNSLWQVKWWSGITNLSFTSQCWNADTTYLRLKFTSDYPANTSTFYCWNGSSWYLLYNVSSIAGFIAEEAIWWNTNNTALTGWCYQEQTNESTACGGLSNGHYNYVPYYLYVNYTVPSYAQSNSLWMVKNGYYDPYNVTIPALCWNNQTLQFRIKSNATIFTTSTIDMECYSGSTWIAIGNPTGASFPSVGSWPGGSGYAIDGNWGTSELYYNTASEWRNVVCTGLTCQNFVFFEEAMWWYISNISLSTVSLGVFNSTGGYVGNGTVTYDDGTIQTISNITNGNATTILTQNVTYSVFVNVTGYSFGYANITPNASFFSHNITLYPYNAFNITFYDEDTNLPIAANETFILIVIRNGVYANNYTVNASQGWNTTDWPVGEYELRYYGLGDYTEYPTPRSYIFTLEAGSFNNLRLYHIKDGISSFFVAYVIDQYSATCANCTVSLIRGQVEGGSYIGYTVEMARTDPAGSAVLRLHPNTVYYKFYITSNTQGSLLTNFFKITSSSSTFQVRKTGTPGSLFTILSGSGNVVNFNPSTDTFTMNWADSTNQISKGCLEVMKTTSLGVKSVVSNACSVGSTGSVVYTVVDTNSSYQATGTIYTAIGNYTVIAAHDYSTSYAAFGVAGALFVVLLLLFGVFLVAPSAEGVIIVASGGVMIMSLIGIIAGSWMAVGGIAIVGVLVIYMLNRGN